VHSALASQQSFISAQLPSNATGASKTTAALHVEGVVAMVISKGAA